MVLEYLTMIHVTLFTMFSANWEIVIVFKDFEISSQYCFCCLSYLRTSLIKVQGQNH